MEFFESRYYRINRILLSTVGLWPYLNWRRKLITVSILTIFFIFGVYRMILKMFKEECTIDFLASSMQYLVPCIVCVINLCYCTYYNDRIKVLVERIEYDWSLLSTADSQILQHHAELAKLQTSVVATLGVMVALLQFSLVSMAREWDTNELNESVVQSPFPFDVPIFSYEEYAYIAVFIVVFLSGWALLIIAAPGTLYLCSVQHACGLFHIVGHRMENMFYDWKGDCSCQKKDKIAEILRSIVYHGRAIEFTGIMSSMYGSLYLYEMCLYIVLLCGDLLQMYQACIQLRSLKLAAVCTGHVTAALVSLLAFSYNGQILLDCSGSVFFKVYMSEWYLAPVKMQKLLLPVMCNSFKEYGVVLTFSSAASFRQFLTILQLSMSYVITMNSLQG